MKCNEKNHFPPAARLPFAPAAINVHSGFFICCCRRHLRHTSNFRAVLIHAYYIGCIRFEKLSAVVEYCAGIGWKITGFVILSEGMARVKTRPLTVGESVTKNHKI
jgi:hypothetical protein